MLFDGEKKNVDNVMQETKTCVANTNAWLSALHIVQKSGMEARRGGRNLFASCFIFEFSLIQGKL
jgi:hypothetical protein